MKFNFIIESFDDYKKIFKIIEDQEIDLILFSGDLGAGKTSFIGAFLTYLHGEEEVQAQGFMSPTFNIINEYEISGKKYAHIDLYRLSEEEIEELDLQAVKYESEMVFIEWFEKSKNLTQSLSKNKAFLHLKKTSSESRELELST